MKLCSKCQIMKHESQFHKRPNGQCRSWCIDCQRAENRERYLIMRKKDHKPRIAKILKSPYFRKHGITKEEMLSILSKQDNVCLICKRPLEQQVSKSGLAPYVDKDPSTKLIKGILCKRCRILVGFAHDDISILQNVIEYMKGNISLQSKPSILTHE